MAPRWTAEKAEKAATVWSPHSPPSWVDTAMPRVVPAREAAMDWLPALAVMSARFEESAASE